jgi:hypothetical protein
MYSTQLNIYMAICHGAKDAQNNTRWLAEEFGYKVINSNFHKIRSKITNPDELFKFIRSGG